MYDITVVSTGYVGLVTGGCLADFGNNDTCADNDDAEEVEAAGLVHVGVGKGRPAGTAKKGRKTAPKANAVAKSAAKSAAKPKSKAAPKRKKR